MTHQSHFWATPTHQTYREGKTGPPPLVPLNRTLAAVSKIAQGANGSMLKPHQILGPQLSLSFLDTSSFISPPYPPPRFASTPSNLTSSIVTTFNSLHHSPSSSHTSITFTSCLPQTFLFAITPSSHRYTHTKATQERSSVTTLTIWILAVFLSVLFGPDWTVFSYPQGLLVRIFIICHAQCSVDASLYTTTTTTIPRIPLSPSHTRIPDR
jgi:hypothetical protein